MKRFATFALLGLSLGASVGCGEKPPPIVEAKPVEKDKAKDGELKPPPKPPESNPVARKLLDDMLAAHTGGKPEKLDAFRECTFTRKGSTDAPGGRITAVWKRDLIWPDRYRMRTEMSYPNGAKITQTFGLRGEVSWKQPGEDAAGPKTPLEAQQVPSLKGQLQEDGLTLLFLFADPKVVVANPLDEKVYDKELTSVDVWLPNGEYARLGVDKKTKLLFRILYLGYEASSAGPLTKEITFQEYQEFNGVKLGSKTFAKTRTQSLGEWTELSVETTKPDPKVFDGP